MDYERLGLIHGAFTTIHSTQASQTARDEAQRLVDGFASAPENLSEAWNTFIFLTQACCEDKPVLPSYSHEIRFWCVQTVLRHLSLLELSKRQALTESLWTDYFDKAFPILHQRKFTGAGDNREYDWVLNKLITLYCGLIAADYPDTWKTPFRVFGEKIREKSLLSPGPDNKDLIAYIDCFVRLQIILDSEYIADEISSRTETERNLAMKIKDGIRELDIQMVLEIFAQILNGSLFGIEAALIQCLEQGGADKIPQCWINSASDTLKGLSKLTAWVDTGLIVDQKYKFLDFIAVATQLNFGPNIAKGALEVLQALMYKRMDGASKCVLMERFSLIPLAINACSVTVSEPTHQVQIATALDTIAMEVLEAMKDIQKQFIPNHPGGSVSSDNGSDSQQEQQQRNRRQQNQQQGTNNPYRTVLSEDEARKAVRWVWRAIEALVGPAVNILTSPNKHAAERIIPFLKEFFRVLRSYATSDQGEYLCNVVQSVDATLSACTELIVIPPDFDWVDLSERDDAFFESSDEDGSRESEFFVLRKNILQLAKRVFTVACVCPPKAAEFINSLAVVGQAAATKNPPSWNILEAVVTMMVYCQEIARVYPNAGVTEVAVECLASWREHILQPGSPGLMRICYFEALSSMGQFCKSMPDTNRELVSKLCNCAMQSFYCDQGIKSTDGCKRVVTAAIRGLLRFSKSMKSRIADMVPLIVSDLARSGYLQVRPVSEELVVASEATGASITLYDPAIPALAVEDQAKLFEFVGLIGGYPDATREAVLQDILNVTFLPEKVAEYLSSQAPHAAGEWLGRLLRCLGNLLKGYNVISQTTESIDQIAKLAILALRVRGDKSVVQQNVLYNFRRLINLAPAPRIKVYVLELLELLVKKMKDSITPPPTDADTVGRIANDLRNGANFVSGCIGVYADETLTTMFCRSVGERMFFATLMREFFEIATALIASGECGGEVRTAVEDILAIVQTAATKAPIGLLLECFLEQTSTGQVDSIQYLLEGVALGVAKPTMFTVGQVQAYTSLMTSLLGGPVPVMESLMKTCAQQMVQADISLEPALRPVITGPSARKAILHVLTPTTTKYLECLQAIFAAFKGDSIARSKLLEVTALLLRVSCGGSAKKSPQRPGVITEEPEIIQDVMPFQAIALNYLRISLEGGDSAELLLEAMRTSTTDVSRRDALALWLQSLPASSVGAPSSNGTVRWH